jgi:hypothetical protein
LVVSRIDLLLKNQTVHNKEPFEMKRTKHGEEKIIAAVTQLDTGLKSEAPLQPLRRVAAD